MTSVSSVNTTELGYGVSTTSRDSLLNCPACGGQAAHAWSAPAGEQGLSDFGVAICSTCGTGVTEGDFPVDAELYEKGSYAPERARGAGLAAPILRLFDRRRLQFIGSRFKAPARVIDAGCGRGRFVAAAAAAGFDSAGVEPTERGCIGARDMYGIELIQSNIETAPVTPGSCDVVTLWSSRTGSGLEAVSSSGSRTSPACRRGWPALAGTTWTYRATGRTSLRPGSTLCSLVTGS